LEAVGIFLEKQVEAIAALILTIAAEFGVPPQFALAVALEENHGLNPLAVHINSNGTRDLGIMQLNSSWYTGDWQDPETNIRAGCGLIRELKDKGLNWWQVAVAYNAGYRRLREGPPDCSIEYANRVFERWNGLRGIE
jgi:soluble lytic murein transglycosylase-like protein